MNIEGSLSQAGGAPRTDGPRDAPAAREERATTAVAAGLRESADRSHLAVAVVEGPTHVIRYANAAFRVLTGTESTRVIGTSLRDLMPPVEEAVIELLSRVREQHVPQTDVEIACDLPAPMPSAAAWRVTVWPVAGARTSGGGVHDADHLVVHLCDLTADVAERRRHEALIAELREVNERLVLASLREQTLREQAQAASVAKSAFLATMSHELRTPLTAIIGYEELLSDGITGPVTDAQRQQLARIKSCSDHLLSLIDEVLTLSRVEAKQEVAHLAPVRVVDLVETTATLVAPMAAAKGLTLTTELPPPAGDAPLTLNTDAIKVRQILLNLLSNAIKYSERGAITLSMRVRDDAVIFEVRDTGIGIAAEHLEHIFDTFWQVRQTWTRTAEGAGLGLSVSRRLAQLLGGNVTAESVEGQGSSFALSLPLVTAPTAGAPASAATRSSAP